jgi:hypothetical protein
MFVLHAVYCLRCMLAKGMIHSHTYANQLHIADNSSVSWVAPAASSTCSQPTPIATKRCFWFLYCKNNRQHQHQQQFMHLHRE